MALLQRLGQSVAGLFGGRGGPSDDPNEPRFQDEYVNFVDTKFDEYRKARLPEELQWRLNLAFASGDQFLAINHVSNNLEEVPLLHDSEEREVFDQISPILEARHSRLSRGDPRRVVRPASDRQDDLSRAQTSAKVIQYTETETDHSDQLELGIAWSERLGGFFKKNLWYGDKGRVLALVQDETGQTQELREGDLVSTVVPYTEIYPEDPYRSYKDNRAIIHAKAFTVQEIEEQWGVNVQPEHVEILTLQPGSVGARGLEYVAGKYTFRSQKLQNSALVKEYWERSSKKFPDGRLIIVAGKQLLHLGPLPFMVGKDGTPDLPFTHYPNITQPGLFFGTCLMPRLIPLQRRWNSLRNREAEYLKRVAIGQLMVEEGSLDNIEDVELNAYDPGFIFILRRGGAKEPRYMEFPPLPATFQQEKETLEREFQVLSGVSDVAKVSKSPNAADSGIALEILLEQDDTRLAPTRNNLHRGLVSEAKHWLRLYRQFVKVPRLARVTNRSEVELVEWVGSDLNNDDVIIEGGSGLGESLAQRRKRVMDLLQAGLLADPQTGQISREARSKALEAMEMGYWESAADSDYDLQRSKQQREIKLIMQGILPNISPIDDHVVHAETLRRQMLTSEFEEAAAANPNVLVAAMTHYQEHLAAAEQQLAIEAQQRAQMQAGQGQPGGQPTPEPARSEQRTVA